MELSKGIIKADLIMAKQGLEKYKENTKIKDLKNMVAYHIQQAVEKMIKIQIYKSGIAYDNKSIYTHDINNLIVYARLIGVDLVIPKAIEDNCMTITDWEAGSRYDIKFSVRVDTLEKYLEVCNAWIEKIK